MLQMPVVGIEAFQRAALMRDAEQATGLADWGEPEFLEPLDALLESLRNEAQLHERGRARAKSYLLRILTQRLRMIDDRERRPEIARQVIDRPTILTGFPRAGTTYLHRLLGVGGGMRSPATWQLWAPSPPPNDPAIDHTGTIEAVETELRLQGWLDPEIRQAHFHAALEPDEDFFAFEYSLVSTGFLGLFEIPGYSTKVLTGDFAPAYRWLARVLQAMQVGLENVRWALKAPEHTMHLSALAGQFPDARIVQHHRDPARIMASVFSMMTLYQAKYGGSGSTMTGEGAWHFLQMYARGVGNVIAQRRDAALDARFLDVSYLDLERDPVACVRRVYDHAGVPFDQHTATLLSAWIADNRKGKHGLRRYSLEPFGLTATQVRDAFSDYLDRFDIELED